MIVHAILPLLTVFAQGQSTVYKAFERQMRSGFLDRANYASWEDLKALSRTERATYVALRAGDQEKARQLLLKLRASREDSVLVRKGMIDVERTPAAIRKRAAGLAARTKKGEQLSTLDVFELGYSVAFLSLWRGDENRPDSIFLAEAVPPVRALLSKKLTFPEFVALGTILSEIGGLGDARSAFRKAVDLEPSRVAGRLTYAWSLSCMSTTGFPLAIPAALTQGLAVVKQAPKRADAYKVVASCYMQLGDEKRALPYFRSFLIYGDPSTRFYQEIKKFVEGKL